MSMPSFPQNGVDMTREEALNLIIACIAMEELALSHILNAGGEHLQFILGTLPGTSSQDVLAAHKSITALIEAVTHNQMLLKNKLDRVLEFVPRPSEPAPTPPASDPTPPSYPVVPGVPSEPPPHPPQHPPQYNDPWPPYHPDYRVPLCTKSVIHLMGQREKMLWEPDTCLLWRPRSCSGPNICWNGCAPGQIQLSSGKRYAVQYTLQVCAVSPAEGGGRILLCHSPCGVFGDTPPLCLPLQRLTRGRQTLHHVAVLHPCTGCECGAALSLVLNAQTPLRVERASMDIVEL